ncbi:MAG: hypothetical protein AAFQ63_07340 [Cyanobacteria bacterium J06621_11]
MANDIEQGFELFVVAQAYCKVAIDADTTPAFKLSLLRVLDLAESIKPFVTPCAMASVFAASYETTLV